MQNSNNILVIIAVTLIAILGVLVYQNQHPKSPGEKIAESVSETFENVGDKIDENIK